MNTWEVVKAVASVSGVPVELLVSPERCDRPVYHARQCAYFLAREVTGLSFPQIARTMKRDHSTVLHGAEAVSWRLRSGDRRTSDIILDARDMLNEIADRAEAAA